MAADPRLTNAAASAAADAVVDRIDTGGAGTIKIYTGTIPTDADTAIGAQVLLATLTFAATAFGAAANGVATAAAITSDSSADATGTAAWARIATGGGTHLRRYAPGRGPALAALAHDTRNRVGPRVLPRGRRPDRGPGDRRDRCHGRQRLHRRVLHRHGGEGHEGPRH